MISYNKKIIQKNNIESKIKGKKLLGALCSGATTQNMLRTYIIVYSASLQRAPSSDRGQPIVQWRLMNSLIHPVSTHRKNREIRKEKKNFGKREKSRQTKGRGGGSFFFYYQPYKQSATLRHLTSFSFDTIRLRTIPTDTFVVYSHYNPFVAMRVTTQSITEL